MKKIFILSVLLLGLFLTNFANANPPVDPPVITGLNQTTFNEGSDPIVIDPNVLISNGGNYGGGYLLFDLSNGDLQDQLGIKSDAAGVDPNALGIITYASGIFYLGNGNGKDVIASIDGTLNGQNGNDLKINFTSNFPNPSFEDNTTGWTVGLSQVDLGVTSILGYVTPDDPTNTPYNNNDGDSDIPRYGGGSYYYQISTSEHTEGNSSLRLYSSMTTQEGCDVVHGPYAYSSEFESSAGDILQFDWRAYAGSDAYDVFGYLLNTATGASTIVLNETGQYSGSTNWATASVNVPADGKYRFVFVSGTYDATCGLAAGASLYIDNFKVYGDKADSDVVTALARRVTYQNACGTSNATRDLELSVKNLAGNIVSATSTITLNTEAPQPPTTSYNLNRTIEVDNTGDIVITPDEVDPGYTDDCAITKSLSKTTFGCADVGVHNVTLTLTDTYGNTATENFVVTVVPKDPATVLTNDITVYLDANGNATITVAMIDNGSINGCGGIASLTLDRTTFTCADIGENTVVLTLTDNVGTTYTAEAIVTVVDNIIPTVFARNVTVNLDDNGAASVTAAMINNGSYDNCGIASLSLSKTTFNCSNIGTNTVTLTVTDDSGNTNTTTAIVFVRDNMAPQLQLVAPITIHRVDGNYMKYDIRELVDLVMDNADACNGNLQWAIFKASSDEPEDAQGRDDGSTVNDIVISDDGQEIEVRAESSSRGNGRVYEVFIRAVDGSGNETVKSLLITVNERGRYTAVNDGASYWVYPGYINNRVPPQLDPIPAGAMMQNAPNPFKTATIISFNQEKDEYVSLAIYSMAGRLIKTLVSEVKPAGDYTVEWTADDDDGKLVPPGMYIYVLKTDTNYSTKKMLLLK